MTLTELIFAAQNSRASDIHLSSGLTPRFRIDGELVEGVRGIENILSNEDTSRYAKEMAGAAFDELDNVGELDMGQTFIDPLSKESVRTRINIFKQRETVAICIRLLNNRIPKLADLNLPAIVNNFPKYERGIVLVTGETGSGKSTTLAAILQTINETRQQHIITLESPIEYIYEPDKCVISQREVGRDTASFQSGLRAALREDPDVILVGEMRDLDTIETALTAAETGHIVFATLHTNSAAGSIDRIVDVFSEGKQRQIRMQLSMTLKATLSQQLLPRYLKKGRIAVCEVMVVTPAIRNLIREGKTPQIENAIASSAALGNVTMDNALIKCSRERLIDPKVALSAAHDSDYISKQLGVI